MDKGASSGKDQAFVPAASSPAVSPVPASILSAGDAVMSAHFCVRNLTELLAVMDGRTFIPGTLESEIVKRSIEVISQLVVLVGDFSTLRPMASAPKDRPILAWCDDECHDDRCGCHTSEGTSLCLFHGHAEGLSSTGTGWRVVEWGGAWDDSTWEYPNAGHMPDWWFRIGSEFEEAANPVVWLSLPDMPAQAIKARRAATTGAVHESAVLQDAPNPDSPPKGDKG